MPADHERKPRPQVDPTPITGLELPVLVAGILSLAEEANRLKAEAQAAEFIKFQRINELRARARHSDLPPESAIIVGALFRSAESLEEMTREVAGLLEIDEQLKASRGQSIIWLSSERELTVHRSAGSNEYGTRNLIHMGTLPYDASLGVNRHGEFIIPVRNEIEHDILVLGKIDPEAPLNHLQIKSPWNAKSLPLKENTNIFIPEDLQKFTIIIGNQAVEKAISQAKDRDQEELNDFLERTVSASS